MLKYQGIRYVERKVESLLMKCEGRMSARCRGASVKVESHVEGMEVEWMWWERWYVRGSGSVRGVSE